MTERKKPRLVFFYTFLSLSLSLSLFSKHPRDQRRPRLRELFREPPPVPPLALRRGEHEVDRDPDEDEEREDPRGG